MVTAGLPEALNAKRRQRWIAHPWPTPNAFEHISASETIPLDMRGESFDQALQLISKSVRVEHIMTPENELVCSSVESDASNAKDLSNSTGYDVIPIRNEKTISAYYEKENGTTLQIRVENLINWGSAVSNCLGLFHENEFFFVNRENGIVGFVNQADLDKPPVRLLFYVLISRLETVLVSVITSAYQKDSWSRLLSQERRAKLKQIFDAKEKRGLQVDLVSCLNLSDMLTILQKGTTLLKTLHFGSRSECEKTCGGLDQLRNDIMHTISPTLLGEGTKKLLERLENLRQLTQRCQEALPLLDTSQKISQ